MTRVTDFSEIFTGSPVPDADTIGALPYGRQLKALFYPVDEATSPNGDPKGSRHLRTVLERMGMLLSNQPAQILSDYDPPICRESLAYFETSYHQIWHGVGEGLVTTAIFPVAEHQAIRTFLRVAALYHDIGKYINTDRHPAIGWYLVTSMYPAERARLRGMLNPADLRTLLTIIRDHDKFGVLSTGEGSMPLLASITNLMQEEVKTQKKRLTALMLVSLADMSASFPLTSCVAGTVTLDWGRMIAALENAWGDRGRLLDHIVHEAQQYENTVERIRRLLMEASLDPDGQWKPIDDRELVSDVLKTTFMNRIDVFCEDFALVAKLDYSLKFFRLVVQRCRERGTDSPTTIAHILISILKGIVDTYSGMLHSRRGRHQIIGIEFSGLTPPHAPERANALIDLLLERPAEGLAWLLSDVPAWYIWE